jgi:hypothetical protein
MPRHMWQWSRKTKRRQFEMSSFFTVSIFALLFSQSPAQERDLSGYEKMEFTVDATKESGEPYAVKEREFIWNCWNQKLRCFAYLKAELKDTRPSVIQIFVEPDEKEVWNAVYMIDAQPLDKKGKPKGKPVSWRYSIQKIVRIEATGSLTKIKEIPDDEVRTAGAYRIFLKSSPGALKQGFEFLFGSREPRGLIF